MNPLRPMKSLMIRRHAADFWQALRLIRCELNEYELAGREFPVWECGPDRIRDALHTLDRWLEIATEEGWCEYDG